MVSPRFVGILIISIGFSSLAQARSSDVLRLGQSTLELNQDSLRTNRVGFNTYWQWGEWLAYGPSLTTAFSDDSIELFDRYREANLGADVVARYPIGKLVPYFRLNVTLLSYFQAQGKLRTSDASAADDSSVAYTFEGQNRGYERAIGLSADLTPHFALLWEVSLLSSNLSINKTNLETGFDTTHSDIDVKDRSGLSLTRVPGKERLQVEPEHRRYSVSASAIAMGFAYKM